MLGLAAAASRPSALRAASASAPGRGTPPPSANSGTLGKLVNISMPRNPPVTASACGREKSCCMNSRGKFDSLRAARHEQAGGQRNQERRHLAHQAVADRQLRVKLRPPRRSVMPYSTMPMISPPTMLISVMMMPAMASPRTNLLAPSIAPKKSACCVISLAAALGLRARR